MMFRLRENLHWCVSGGRVVFLDAEADRYFGLCRATEQAFIRVYNEETRAEDVEQLRQLLSRGMLVHDCASPGIRPPLSVRQATCDFLPAGHGRTRSIDVLAAFASEARIAWRLAKGPLLRLVEEVAALQARRPCPPGEDGARITGILKAASTVSLIRGSADRCLVRALAVQATCRRNGICPQLVFGVRVAPFRAHCWLQLDATVLVGDFEQARLFTPIMAVG